MITSNIHLSDWVVNGQFGIVFDFGYISSSITKVYLKLDDEKASNNAMLKDPYASKQKIVPIQKIETNIKINKNSSETFKRTQFPLTLAWVCTVHKVPGLTLYKTVVSLELVKQITFSPGQIYVALSRSTFLSKLIILSDFDPKIIRATQLAIEQYEYLKKEKHLIIFFFHKEAVCCTVKYKRNVKKHFKFTGDSRLMEVPLICQTKRYLLSAIAVNSIPTALEMITSLIILKA